MFSEKSSSEGDDEQVEDFDLEKSNIMVFGPTGSGKTHIIKVRSMKNQPKISNQKSRLWRISWMFHLRKLIVHH